MKKLMRYFVAFVLAIMLAVGVSFFVIAGEPDEPIYPAVRPFSISVCEECGLPPSYDCMISTRCDPDEPIYPTFCNC